MNGDQKTQTPGGEWQPKPGDNPPSLTEPSQKLTSTVAPPAIPLTPDAPVANAAQPAASVAAPAPDSNQLAGFFHSSQGDDSDTGRGSLPLEEPVSWVSSGEALQAHSATWRLRMTLAAALAGGLIFLITRDWIAAAAVALGGAVFGFLGARKPPALSYTLDSRGVTIGRKRYAYSEFRAFSVSEYPSLNANLVPFKRFLPVLSIHLDPSLQERAVAMLGNHLPLEQHRNDAVDKIISKARF